MAGDERQIITFGGTEEMYLAGEWRSIISFGRTIKETVNFGRKKKVYNKLGRERG